jgi:competence protein ComEC
VVSDHDYRSATYRQLLATLSKRGIPLERWRAAEASRRQRSGTLTVLWPVVDKLPQKGGRADDFGLVLELRSSIGRCLFAADAGENLENRLAASAERPIALLVQGLHANESSFTLPYLQALQPGTIVLNSGDYPPNAYPPPEVQDRLTASGARVLRTDQTGGAIIQLTSAGVQVRSFLNAPALR